MGANVILSEAKDLPVSVRRAKAPVMQLGAALLVGRFFAAAAGSE